MSKRQINYGSDKEKTAKRLKEALENKNMTASELSERSHVSKSSISQYLHAIQSPSNLSASSMAKVLGVDALWLMGFDSPKEDRTFDERFIPVHEQALESKDSGYIVHIRLTSEEIILIEKFRDLNSFSKQVVLGLIDRELEHPTPIPKIPGQQSIFDNEDFNI